MSKKTTGLGAIAASVFLAVIGLLILKHHDAFVKIVVICAGISAFADGVYTLFYYRKWNFADLTRRFTLIKGILMTVCGVFGIVMPIFAATAVITVITYIFAIMLVYSAFVSLQDAFVLRNISSDFPRAHFYVEAVFSLIVAVIFFSNPNKILSTLVDVIAISVLVFAFLFLAYGILVIVKKKKQNRVSEGLNQ